ncbi:halocyanin domain-containing protein [Natronorarus salvus]|uniref:halocyanin domain-containing protein n=1 Tax=Natronorarus salvus TaxID=3117733 RepID=UPI002F26C586
MTTRREVLKALAATTAIGAAGLAGCTSRAAPATNCVKLGAEPNYKGWFDGVETYDGTCDFRGEDEVRVLVGAKGTEAYWEFLPAAVAVTPGTTVVWEWTGMGGVHDVVSDGGTFSSGKPHDEKGETFEFTFDEPGVYRYVCTPHQAMGMKGAVFVALE